MLYGSYTSCPLNYPQCVNSLQGCTCAYTQLGECGQRHVCSSYCLHLFKPLLFSAAAREHLLAEALAEAQRLHGMEDGSDGEGSPAEGSERTPALPLPAPRQGAAEMAGACAKVTILGADTEVRDHCVLVRPALNVLTEVFPLHGTHIGTCTCV